MDERDVLDEAELKTKTQNQTSNELAENTQAQEVIQEDVATELSGTDPWLQRKQENSETVVEENTEAETEVETEAVVEEVD